MITSIKQAHTEFFRIFHGIEIPIKGVMTKIPCRYARKSSFDYSEEQDNQFYPCIAIQDYTPELKEEWYIDMKSYFGGLSSDGLKGFLYRRPVWMSFRYDVSVVAKGYSEFVEIQDYFLRKFVSNVRFLYNKKLTGEDMVGDVVPYSVRETDIPRTDGVFEKNYEFTLSVWVYPQEPTEVETITNIFIGLTREAPGVDSEFISLDGKGIVSADEHELSNIVRSKLTSSEIEEILTTAVVSKDVDKIVEVTSTETQEVLDNRTLYISKEE